MALQLVVDSLDGMDDSIRSLYVESNGKFTLDVDGIDKAESVQTAIRREREARKEAEKRLKELGNLSREDIDELESLRAEAAKARGAEELVARERTRAARERETLEKQLSELRARAESKALESTAMELAAAHKGNFKLLKYHLLNELQAEEADGDFRAIPKNHGSLDEVIATMKATFPEAFADSGHSGGGAIGGGGGGNGRQMGIDEFNRLPPAEQYKFKSGGGEII